MHDEKSQRHRACKLTTPPCILTSGLRGLLMLSVLLFSRIKLYFFFFFLIEFMWVTLVNKLCGFQVHNSTTHHRYTSLCVYHSKPSLLSPPPFILPNPPPPSSTPPLSSHHTAVHVCDFFLSCSTPQCPVPSTTSPNSCQPAPYL